ncbi:20S proteasome maturation factor [Pichia californica]|nr:20S proteasome maturation factor [[Candida] californica]
MSLSIAPEAVHPSGIRNTDYAPSAPSAPGLVDTLRAGGPVSIASKINNRHPIESRILNWEENTTKSKMETHRRIFGMADPIKREMELSIVQQSEFRPQILGGSSNIHSDILKNKDTTEPNN